jgi:hypothetical protein
VKGFHAFHCFVLDQIKVSKFEDARRVRESNHSHNHTQTAHDKVCVLCPPHGAADLPCLSRHIFYLVTSVKSTAMPRRKIKVVKTWQQQHVAHSYCTSEYNRSIFCVATASKWKEGRKGNISTTKNVYATCKSHLSKLYIKKMYVKTKFKQVSTGTIVGYANIGMSVLLPKLIKQL